MSTINVEEVTELEKSLMEIKKSNEAYQKIFEELDLNINGLPNDLMEQIKTIVEFQMMHKIEDLNYISAPLGFTDSILKGVEQMLLDQNLKDEIRSLNRQKKQLNECSNMLSRDESSCEEQKKIKEGVLVGLKTNNVLLQPKMKKIGKGLEDPSIKDVNLNLKVKEIMELKEEIKKLDTLIEDESSYLEQFAGLPPSLSEAAQCVQEEKERLINIDKKMRNFVTR